MFNDDHFPRLEDYITSKLGLRVIDTNKRQVKRFLTEKLTVLNKEIADYIRIIDTNEIELHELINILTINETYFFREQKHYNLLKSVIFPEYIQLNKLLPPVIWSAASSIGAEPLSIALLTLKEWKYIPDNYFVYASDIDKVALSNIQKNNYPKTLLREDGKQFHDLVQKYTDNSGSIVFEDKIISMIKPFPFNLLKTPYPSLSFQPDIVFLCNVLTYMDYEKKDYVIDNIVKAMTMEGFLILSSSDTAFVNHPDLKLMEHEGSFYFKKVNNG